jgi:AcrR family transcriptional regulator
MRRDPERQGLQAALLRRACSPVAAQGYDSSTVPAVVSAARVSRNAFYEFFDDKVDCFVALGHAAEELRGELLSLASGHDWIRRGDAHRDRVFASYEAQFGDLAGRARAEQPQLAPLPPLAARALVYSIAKIVAREVRPGRTESLS